jgi:hypothetical protein
LVAAVVGWAKLLVLHRLFCRCGEEALLLILLLLSFGQPCVSLAVVAADLAVN